MSRIGRPLIGVAALLQIQVLFLRCQFADFNVVV